MTPKVPISILQTGGIVRVHLPSCWRRRMASQSRGYRSSVHRREQAEKRGMTLRCPEWNKTRMWKASYTWRWCNEHSLTGWKTFQYQEIVSLYASIFGDKTLQIWRHLSKHSIGYEETWEDFPARSITTSINIPRDHVIIDRLVSHVPYLVAFACTVRVWKSRTSGCKTSVYPGRTYRLSSPRTYQF